RAGTDARHVHSLRKPGWDSAEFFEGVPIVRRCLGPHADPGQSTARSVGRFFGTAAGGARTIIGHLVCGFLPLLVARKPNCGLAFDRHPSAGRQYHAIAEDPVQAQPDGVMPQDLCGHALSYLETLTPAPMVTWTPRRRAGKGREDHTRRFQVVPIPVTSPT